MVITGVTGAPYYSNFYWGGDTEGEAEAARDAAEAFWTSLVGDVYTAALGTLQGDVAQVDPVTGNTTAVFAGADRTIDFGGGAPQSWATQGLIRWRTGVYANGREIRGRTFIPAVPTEMNGNGAPNTPYINELTAAVAALMALQTAAGDLVVWSRANGSSPSVVSGTPWNQFAVLRSRRD